MHGYFFHTHAENLRLGYDIIDPLAKEWCECRSYKIGQIRLETTLLTETPEPQRLKPTPQSGTVQDTSIVLPQVYDGTADAHLPSKEGVGGLAFIPRAVVLLCLRYIRVCLECL